MLLSPILSLVLCQLTEVIGKQFVMIKQVVSWKDNTKNICFQKIKHLCFAK